VFILPSSAILFLYQQPSIAVMSLHRQTLHKEYAREGVREVSLKRIDLAEELVVLHERAQYVNTL
jgi:hypothetical protein